MAAAGELSYIARQLVKFRKYHERHPIIVGYMALISVWFPCIAYWEWQNTSRTQQVMKYRREFIILRPDDPAVRMIKKGKIGMDY